MTDDELDVQRLVEARAELTKRVECAEERIIRLRRELEAAHEDFAACLANLQVASERLRAAREAMGQAREVVATRTLEDLPR